MREVLAGGLRAPYIGCHGAIFGSGNLTSSSVARGALRAGASATGARHKSQRFAPLIYREPVRELHRSLYARSMEASLLVRYTIL